MCCKAAKTVQTLAMRELKRVGTAPQSARLAAALKELLQVVRLHAEGGGSQGEKLVAVSNDVAEAARILRNVPTSTNSPLPPEKPKLPPSPRAGGKPAPKLPDL